MLLYQQNFGAMAVMKQEVVLMKKHLICLWIMGNNKQIQYMDFDQTKS
jgi:hypothetical protein